MTKSPVIVKLKILFQDVCCEKFAWDNILPESYLSVFYDILTGLRETKKIFERVYYVKTTEDSIQVCNFVQVHGFYDVSERNSDVAFIRGF